MATTARRLKCGSVKIPGRCIRSICVLRNELDGESRFAIGDDGIRFHEFTFADPAKIRQIVARSATRMLLEDSSAFEYGLKNGAGVILLT